MTQIVKKFQNHRNLTKTLKTNSYTQINCSQNDDLVKISSENTMSAK